MPTFEVSGLRELRADLGRAGAITGPALRATFEKAAVNIKEAMRADLRASKHFAKAANDVSYDVTTDDDGFTYEIGPAIGRGMGHAGGLAHLAYEGSPSNPGAKVRDPQNALEDEAPALERHVDEILRGVL